MPKRWFGSKRCSYGVAAVFLSLALTAPGFAKDPKEQGFSGKWVLDKKTSHGSEPLDDLKQSIKMGGNDVTIQTQFPEPKNAIAPLVYLGIMVSVLKLSTDGQELTNQIGPYAFAAKTTVDGNKMTTEWHSQNNGDPVQGTWVRTLSDDAKHMTLVITESSTKGQTGDATLNFNRK